MKDDVFSSIEILHLTKQIDKKKKFDGNILMNLSLLVRNDHEEYFVESSLLIVPLILEFVDESNWNIDPD